MSNARNRANELHAKMLAPKRVTNRVIAPDAMTVAALRSDMPHTTSALLKPVPTFAEVQAAVAEIRAYSRNTACRGAGPIPQCGCSACVRAKQAQPEPGAFVVPCGWERNGNTARIVGTEAKDKSPTIVTDALRPERGWWAWRDGEIECHKDKLFASPYAAMLCALGCEVEQNAERDRWGVREPDGCVWDCHDDDDLRYIVERLTAERAQSAAKPSRSRASTGCVHCDVENDEPCIECAPPSEPAAESLAPGWSVGGPHLRDMPVFQHASGARVWERSRIDSNKSRRWGWDQNPNDIRAPGGVCADRDEAMALALGWSKGLGWRDGDRYLWRCDNRDLLAALNGNGTWSVLRAGGCSATSFPSLSHAIAWARGDAP